MKKTKMATMLHQFQNYPDATPKPKTLDEVMKRIKEAIEICALHRKRNYNPSLKLAHDVTKALRTTIDDLFIFEEDEGRR